MKTCTRCQAIKPPEAFKPKKHLRDGLDSWCRDCANAANREWRRRYPAAVAAQKEIDLAKYDPTTYSRRVCEHISEYADRAITRFEKHTGQEAPPQLTVIRQLAQKIVDEHPPPRIKKTELQCNYCRVIYYKPKCGASRYCSELCRDRDRDRTGREQAA